MSLATHVLRKDVRHLRILIVVWLIVVVLKTIFTASDLAYTADSRSLQWTLWWLTVATSILSVALAVAIVPLVIQDDSTVGTTAFWLTRPISRFNLLLGKTSFLIAILVIPPLLAELIVFIIYRVTGRDIVLAVPEIFLMELLFLLPLTLLAVLTPSLPRFILFGVVILVSLILIVSLVASLVFHRSEEQEEIVAVHGRVPALAGFLAPLIAGGAVIVHQYLTRKTARSVLLVLIGLILFSLLPYFPLGFAAKPDWPAPDERIFDPERVTASLDLESVSVSDSFSFRATDRPKKTIGASLNFSGVKPEFMVAPEHVDARLQFPDGTTFRFKRPTGFVSGGSSLNPNALREAFNGAKLLYKERYNYDLLGRSAWQILELDARAYDQYRKKAGIFSANVRFRVSRYRLAGELPFTESARLQKDSDHVLIIRILDYPNGRRMIVREGNLNLVFSPLRSLTHPRLYVLSNRSIGEVILAREQPLTEGWYVAGGFSFTSEGGRFTRRLTVLDFSGEDRTGKTAIQLDDRWLRDTRLFRVEVEHLGYFSKPLRVENFQLQAAAGQLVNQSAPVR